MTTKPCCNDPKPLPPDPVTFVGPPRPMRIAELAIVVNERMAMCLTCRHAPTCEMGRPDPRLHNRLRVETAKCPRGRWPGEDGLVRVAITYQGVPFPVRLRRGCSQAWMVFRMHMREDGMYRGCGCVHALRWAKPLVPWGKAGWANRGAVRSLASVLAKAYRWAARAGGALLPWRKRSVCTTCGGVRNGASGSACNI